MEGGNEGVRGEERGEGGEGGGDGMRKNRVDMNSCMKQERQV